MEARAVEKYIRMSPRKIKYVIDLIKEKQVEEAVDILTFTQRRAAPVVRKAIESAVSNAVENFKEYKISEEELYIKEIYVTEGPMLKRWRPRARGRADRLLKRTSHVTVVLSDEVSAEKKEVTKVKRAEKTKITGKAKTTDKTVTSGRIKNKRAGKKADKQVKKEAKV